MNGKWAYAPISFCVAPHWLGYSSCIALFCLSKKKPKKDLRKRRQPVFGFVFQLSFRSTVIKNCSTLIRTEYVSQKMAQRSTLLFVTNVEVTVALQFNHGV